MKILRIYTKLPPLPGGMEKHIAELSKEQLKLKHNVSIYFNQGNTVTSNDVRIMGWMSIGNIKPQFIGFILFYFAVLVKLKLNGKNFDVLHIHGDYSSLIFAGFIKKIINAKILALSIHDKLDHKYIKQKIFFRLIKKVNLIFTCGYDTAKYVESICSKETKVIPRPSGIRDVFFENFDKNFDNSNFTIITVSNLMEKKNVKLILKIAQQLNAYNFVVIGDGPCRNSLESDIIKLKINNLKLLGHQNTSKVVYHLHKADCFLLTSTAEGMPTSILEAMACGLPIVTSDIGGITNLIKNGKNGFVVKDYDVNNFSKKIKKIKSDIDLRKDIFANNKLLANDFSWKQVAKNIIDETTIYLNEKN
ncbi:glycosyl transferase, group 1 family protein [uncultured Candidatus Thioglobus sp.]|nr:glycosyl transferase, group 1 family protein [uncultured Candidatus Thioglobus sp.]